LVLPRKVFLALFHIQKFLKDTKPFVLVPQNELLKWLNLNKAIVMELNQKD